MRRSTFINVLLLATSTSAQRADGQFWPCNPLKNVTGACPPNRGLPTSSYSVDFTKQTTVPANWTISNYATVNFGSQGAEFTFNKRWDAPQMWTDFSILFGRVSVVARVANGTGMISSAVLISDAFDEIDFEMSGNNFGHPEWSAGKGQNNYFGKGIVGTYDRGSYFEVSNPQGTFHTYTFDWTPTELKWLVDGRVVRSHLASDGDTSTHQYPQTPSKFQLGIWAGGDPSSNQGTREWAGGYTDLEGGPYTMWVKSVVIENAMPAWGYNYTDQSGDWRSIALLQRPVDVISSSSGTTSKSVTSASKSATTSTRSASKSTASSASKSTTKTLSSASKSAASSASTSKSSAGVSSQNSTVKPSTATSSSRPMTVPHATTLISVRPSSSAVKPSSTAKPSSTVKPPSTSKVLTSSISKTSTSTLRPISTTKVSKTASPAGTTKPSSIKPASTFKSTSAKSPPGYVPKSAFKSSTAVVSKQPTATAISVVSQPTVAKRPTATTISGVKYVYSHTTTTKCSTTATPKPKHYKGRAATSSATDWAWNGESNQWHEDGKRPGEGRHTHHAHRH